MAAGMTTASVLSSISQGHLECSICHSRYQEPKMLDCSHSFCLKCLQELKKTQNPHCDKITCPLCQRETILPEGGVTKLNNNYTLISLVEEVTKQEQLLKGEVSKVVICQACDEENEAISRCMDCEQFLCQECQKAHQRFNRMKTHKITTLTELQEGKSALDDTESKKNISRCDVHPNQKLCFYCNTCEQLICKQCAASSHKEPIHNFVDFSTAFVLYLQEARQRISQTCSYKSPFKPWELLRKRLHNMLAETNSHISKTAEKKIKQIRQEENHLKQIAKATYRQKDKTLAQIIVAEQTVKIAQKEMKQADFLEVLKFRQDHLLDFKDVPVVMHEEQFDDITRDISFIGFKEAHNDVQVGTILLNEKWALLSETKICGDDITSLSTGDVVVLGSKSRVLSIFHDKLIRLNPNGKVVQVNTVCELESEDSNSNIALAVNKDDQHIILTESAVKILTEDCQLHHHFAPGTEAGIEGKPTCLAVDDSNLIAVGYEDKEQISLHNPDGFLIRTLPAPMFDKYLTISNKQLIYTNRFKKKLLCIDFMGNNMFTVETNFSPEGVCCDKGGDIYINSSDYKLYHLNAEGKYIQYTDIKQSGPMTYTSDGKLALVNPIGSIYLYQRV